MALSGDSVLKYGKGPLPSSFESVAYFTADLKEFALPQSQAINYLDWCQSRGLRVIGFDIWAATQPGPTVADYYGFEGDIEACRDAIRVLDISWVLARYGAEAVFNIWVDD